MELWIRSQDKDKLFKCDGLITHCTCEEMPNTGSYELCDCFEGIIATYKTKERALEVLDEIQCHLVNINDSRDSYFYVYEMPKE